MPECQHYEELISAYLDGELSAHEAEELTAHLASCPEIFEEYFLTVREL